MPLPIVYTIRGCDAGMKLWRNFAQNGCGAKQFLNCLEVRAAPFALSRKWAAQGIAHEERRVESQPSNTR